MVVIGADTHKRTHALAAVAGATDARVGERTVRAETPAIWPRCTGRASSTANACGRSRTVGTSPGAWSGRSSSPANAWSASRPGRWAARDAANANQCCARNSRSFIGHIRLSGWVMALTRAGQAMW